MATRYFMHDCKHLTPAGAFWAWYVLAWIVGGHVLYMVFGG